MGTASGWREVPSVDGLLQLPVSVQCDTRGSFTKVLGVSQSADTIMEIVEVFWSQSSRGVIRGLHLQRPPNHGRKLVWVSAGRILDVILDLRMRSPTFGGWCRLLLGPDSGGLLIPAGCAHGFEVLSHEAQVHYAQECRYSPEDDIGVNWDSFGMKWNARSPIISPRDLALQSADAIADELGEVSWE
jgi:dTDP-4-dehydrorhamnose 3,5-epimerase